MGAQVKKTVMNKNVFLPQMSESAPIRGAERKERMPLIPLMRPWDDKGEENKTEENMRILQIISIIQNKTISHVQV